MWLSERSNSLSIIAMCAPVLYNCMLSDSRTVVSTRKNPVTLLCIRKALWQYSTSQPRNITFCIWLVIWVSVLVRPSADVMLNRRFSNVT